MTESALRLRPFLPALQGYTPGEQLAGKNIIKLNTNECPYPPAHRVVERAQESLKSLRLYPNPGSDTLREVLANYHGLKPEQILVGNGSDEILRLLVHAFIGPNDHIAMVDLTYSLYPVLAASFGGGASVYPLGENYELPEAFFDAPEPILFLANPNPPIGILYSREEVARLCRSRQDRLVVIDEAYADFAPRDCVSLLNDFENLVVTRTFSKSYSLAGMRLGYLMGHPALVAELMKLKDSYNLNRVAQEAAIGAIEACGEMRVNARRIVETRGHTVQALKELGYRVPESQGNFVFAIHPDARAHFLALRERGILVRYFDVPRLSNGMRISIGTPEEMQTLIAALKEILK